MKRKVKMQKRQIAPSGNLPFLSGCTLSRGPCPPEPTCGYTAARSFPSSRQASAASPSGAPQAITGSPTRLQPASSQSAAQVRIHSPSPQP